MKIIRDLIRKAKANFVGKSFERKSADSLEQRALKALIKEQEEKIERLRDQVERLVKERNDADQVETFVRSCRLHGTALICYGDVGLHRVHGSLGEYFSDSASDLLKRRIIDVESLPLTRAEIDNFRWAMDEAMSHMS